MIEFLSRRLFAALITLMLATVVVFAVVEVLPGDPARAILGIDAASRDGGGREPGLSVLRHILAF